MRRTELSIRQLTRARKHYDIVEARDRQLQVLKLDQLQREQIRDAEVRRRKRIELWLRAFNNPYIRGVRAKR